MTFEHLQFRSKNGLFQFNVIDPIRSNLKNVFRFCELRQFDIIFNHWMARIYQLLGLFLQAFRKMPQKVCTKKYCEITRLTRNACKISSARQCSIF